MMRIFSVIWFLFLSVLNTAFLINGASHSIVSAFFAIATAFAAGLYAAGKR